MYRRYSQSGAGNMNLSQVNRNRIKNALILLLLVALIVLLVISLPLIRNQGETRSLYIQKIQEECDDALRQANVLSRTEAVASSSELTRIRCNIQSIRTINSLSQATGTQLLDDNSLVTIVNLVDRYQTGINQGGQKIVNPAEYTTSLQNALQELHDTAGNLK